MKPIFEISVKSLALIKVTVIFTKLSERGKYVWFCFFCLLVYRKILFQNNGDTFSIVFEFVYILNPDLFLTFVASKGIAA